MLYRETGINWVWFYDINLIRDQAVITRSFRVHKGNGMPSAKDASFIEEGGYQIDKWKKDGSPGGISGLKKNYKNEARKKFVIINGKDYEICRT